MGQIGQSARRYFPFLNHATLKICFCTCMTKIPKCRKFWTKYRKFWPKFRKFWPTYRKFWPKCRIYSSASKFFLSLIESTQHVDFPWQCFCLLWTKNIALLSDLALYCDDNFLIRYLSSMSWVLYKYWSMILLSLLVWLLLPPQRHVSQNENSSCVSSFGVCCLCSRTQASEQKQIWL